MGQGSSPLLSGPPKSVFVFAWCGLSAQPQQPINDALQQRLGDPAQANGKLHGPRRVAAAHGPIGGYAQPA